MVSIRTFTSNDENEITLTSFCGMLVSVISKKGTSAEFVLPAVEHSFLLSSLSDSSSLLISLAPPISCFVLFSLNVLQEF